MKKLLITLVTFAMFATAAFAQAGYTIDFAGEVDTWLPDSRADVTYRAYIHIPSDMATRLAGNSIESISICCYMGSGRPTPGSVFVSEESVDNIVASASAQIEMLSYGTANGVTPVFQEIKLDIPYEIMENRDFYIGYTVENCAYHEDYPIPVDAGPANRFAGYVDIISESGIESIDLASMGCNLCIKASTIGDVTGIADFCLVSAMCLSDFTLPVITAYEESEINMTLDNIGENEVDTISYRIECDETVATGTQEVHIMPGCSKAISIPTPAFEEGRRTAKVSLTKFNESPVTTSRDIEFIAIDEALASERRFVVEECTGIWCGYSPSGIVAMEYMQKNYPESFVGIAVHASDSFRVADYSPILDLLDGIPSCVINRDPKYVTYPSDTQLEYDYNIWKEHKGAVNISLDAQLTDDYKIDATATATFAFSDSGDYRISFVVLEDGLVATQTNYYSGAGSKGPGDWGNKGSAVKWTFSNTARGIYDYHGIEGSLPYDITKGEEYTFNCILPKGVIQDFYKVSVIALVIDAQTGTIMNACKLPRLDLSAVREVIDDQCITIERGRGFISVEGADADVYSLDGRKVASGRGRIDLSPGIYLVVGGAKTFKLSVT